MQKTVSLLGIKMDLGREKRGADYGPDAIRQVGLADSLQASGYDIRDLGNLESKVSQQLNNDIQASFSISEIARDFEGIAEFIGEACTNESFPLILGGDHSVSVATIAGISKFYENLGVIWFDAHADVNTPETSPTGSIYGMPLAVNLGYGDSVFLGIGGEFPKVKPENVVLIGTREMDAGEEDFLKRHQLRVYSINNLQQRGIEKVVEEALNYLSGRCDGIHLSFDLDALDPTAVPGVRTPSAIGVSLSDSMVALQLMGRSKMITSVEFVEVNPNLDVDYQTAKAVVRLAKSLLIETLP